MSVTLDDVAKKAGVSPKTVSRAVKGEKGMSEETRKEVMRIVEEMGFVLHTQAQNLASGKTHSIALHYPLSNPKLISERLEMNFVNGIAEEAAQSDYYFTLFTGELDPHELTRICRASIADGLILMQVSMDDWRIETLQKLRFPFVMIGRLQDNDEFSFIDFDFEKAVMQAYTHLLDLGHKKIGFFTYPESWLQAKLGPAVRTKLGFQEVIRRFQLEPIYYQPNLSVEESQACVKEAIEQHPDMTAIVALHNRIAVGAINAVRSLGKSVPEDYSLIGIGLGQESDLIIPPLTGIHWEGRPIGQQAANILIQKLNSKKPIVEQILVVPEVEIRSSTAPASR